MSTKHAIAIMALSFGAAVQADQPGLSRFAEGIAYDRDSGTLLYRELHYCGSDLRECTVRYKDTEGALIARKQLDYRQYVTAPSLVLEDFRRDREIRIPVEAEAGDLVVDAGFDNFVRAQWETLVQGEPVTFRFRGVGFDSPIDMKIGLNDEGECDTGSLCLAVNIDSWLLSSFIDPIQLAYSRDDRRLLRYSGISNLRDADGDSMDVDIYYVYPDSESTASSNEDVVYNLTDQPQR